VQVIAVQLLVDTENVPVVLVPLTAQFKLAVEVVLYPGALQL
jgi:hypothetical protein